LLHSKNATPDAVAPSSLPDRRDPVMFPPTLAKISAFVGKTSQYSFNPVAKKTLPVEVLTPVGVFRPVAARKPS
jgi:hypothetical protein